MAEATIPVDLFNPGQVFACLGFLEAADVLLGNAEGGFDWNDSSRVRFQMNAGGNRNPFEVVLEFLANVEVFRCAPDGYGDPPAMNRTLEQEDDDVEISASINLKHTESFPSREADRMALPIQLETKGDRSLFIGNWADGSSRNQFKLYAGNRSAYGIACAMLRGTRDKPQKNKLLGNTKTLGLADLWKRNPVELTATPFDVLTLMGGSFNFDPRGGWTALDAGYSPNKHKEHGVGASPAVELLGVCGMEHARPDEYETRRVRYGVWGVPLPPMLARPALAAASVGVPLKTFQFTLDLSGKNKVVTYSQEESI